MSIIGAISRTSAICKENEECVFNPSSEQIIFYCALFGAIIVLFAAPYLWRIAQQRWIQPRLERKRIEWRLYDLRIYHQNIVHDLETARNALASSCLKWQIALGRFVALDVETTGLKTATSRIIQLAVVLFDDRQCIGKRVWLINPGKRIPPNATKVNKITDDMVSDKPQLKELASEIRPLLERYPVVGHNLKFDYDHLMSDFDKCGINLNLNVAYCTMTRKFGRATIAARSKRKGRNEARWIKLEELANNLNIEPGGDYHDAFVDAKVAGKCFIALASLEVDGLKSRVKNAEEIIKKIDEDQIEEERRLVKLIEKQGRRA